MPIGQGKQETGAQSAQLLLWDLHVLTTGQRYTPTPCTLQEVPDVDIVAISHNHYDHLDVETIRQLYQARKGSIHFFCPLGNVPWFLSMGIDRDEVTELDWWQAVRVDVAGAGSIHLTCTPSQHVSGRIFLDMMKTLWCSWIVEEVALEKTSIEQPSMEEALPQRTAQDSPLSKEVPTRSRKLFFAGDTGYHTVPAPDPSSPSPIHRSRIALPFWRLVTAWGRLTLLCCQLASTHRVKCYRLCTAPPRIAFASTRISRVRRVSECIRERSGEASARSLKMCESRRGGGGRLLRRRGWFGVRKRV